MGLRLKILSGFLILTLMLFIAGAWSIYELRFVGSSVQTMLHENYRSINAAKQMTESLEREDSAILLLLFGQWTEGRKIIEAADAAFLSAFETARNNITIPGEENFISDIERKYKTYKDLWERPIVGTNREGNLKWYFEEVHGAFAEVKASVASLMAVNDETMYKTASGLKARAQRVIMPGIVAVIASFLFALVFNYFINHYVVGPIIRITKGIERFLTTREPPDFHVETSDELYRLFSSLQQLFAHILRYEDKQ